MSSCHLPRRRDLDKFKILVLPDMTGLKADEHAALLRYVRRGGQLLLSGVATLYDEEGRQMQDFALGDVMGLRFQAICFRPSDAERQVGVAAESSWSGTPLPADVRNLALVTCHAPPAAKRRPASPGRENPTRWCIPAGWAKGGSPIWPHRDARNSWPR